MQTEGKTEGKKRKRMKKIIWTQNVKKKGSKRERKETGEKVREMEEEKKKREK